MEIPQFDINQGDYIYYYDSSIGDVVSREWYFPGGTPTGATSPNLQVRYTTPNTSGFPVFLTVSDGTQEVGKKVGVTKVYPEDFSLDLLVLGDSSPISSSDMSYNVTYIATGSTGSGISYYSWDIPGTAGFTGTSNMFTISLYDWKDLTGSDLGVEYSTYVTNPTVSAFTLIGNSKNSTKKLTYNKSGIPDFTNLCDFPTATGPTSHNLSYFDVSIRPQLTNQIGFPGSGFVFKISQLSTLAFNNSSFHAQGESLTLYTPSSDISGGFVNGFLISSYTSFKKIGAPTEVLDGISNLSRYTLGNYMYPGDIYSYLGNTFYFADSYETLAGLTGSRYWSNDSILLLCTDTSFASISSKSYEISGSDLPATKELLNGGFTGGSIYGGPCVPSDNLNDSEPSIVLDFYCSPDRNLSNVTLTSSIIVTLGAKGISNSPDGNLILCQDTSYGSLFGVSSILNDYFSLYDLGPYVGATSSPYFSTYENRYLNDPDYPQPSEFNGIRISILDDYITSSKGTLPLGLTGDSYLLKIVMSGETPAGLTGSNSYKISEWLGLSQDFIVNPYQYSTDQESPRRGWRFNG